MRRFTIILGLLALALMATATTAAAKQSDLSTARAATAGFHNNAAVVAAGYGEFRDAQGIACIEQFGAGGMGIHYASLALVVDPAINAATPEALVYEPEPNGRLRLVAAEYIVFQESGTPRTARRPRCSAASSKRSGARTATACRRSTSCTPGSGSTTRAACSTTGTRGWTARPADARDRAAGIRRPPDGKSARPLSRRAAQHVAGLSGGGRDLG